VAANITGCFPDAAQHGAVRRCSGIVANSVFEKIPGLRRIIPLRFMLRCARETSLYWRPRGPSDHDPQSLDKITFFKIG
jgi:hypothetical protein